MPDLHGFQIKEAVAMSSPAVLITGALTGIGHAAAVIFAQEGAHVVVSGRRDKQGQESDTPRRAGGLMSRTASKAVAQLVSASR